MTRYGSPAWAAALAAVLLSVGLSGCSREEAPVVRLDRKEILQARSSSTRMKPLRIGMGAMISPKEGYLYYHELRQYLEERLGRPVQLVDRDTYGQVIKLMRRGELDASFLCAGPYIDLHDRLGLEPVAVPQSAGRSRYYAYIIVPKDSPVRDFTELRGKTFAFIDPQSNTGKLVPAYMLARLGETPARFFKKVIYTYGHDRAIRAVAEEMVDGAAVSSNIWELFAKKNPELTAKTRIIVRSEPFGAPPFVVSRTLDASTKRRLRDVFLSMHEDPRGSKVLQGMMIERFVPGDDHDYDSVREMQAFVGRHQERRSL